MNRPDFISLIHDPKRDIDLLEPIQELVQRYPYCQASQVLYAFQLYRTNDLDFSTQLRKAAAYTSSRRRLKWLFERNTETRVSIAPAISQSDIEVLSEPDNIHAVEPKAVAENKPDDHKQPGREKLSLLDIVNKRLAEIEAEKKDQELIVNSTAEIPEVLTKREIIDKFIQEEPRISRPKTEFFSPSDLAVKSSQEDDEIVSETLAILYYKQGNLGKAIHIYQKLSLLFPEKSRYFAAQIENLS